MTVYMHVYTCTMYLTMPIQIHYTINASSVVHDPYAPYIHMYMYMYMQYVHVQCTCMYTHNDSHGTFRLPVCNEVHMQ